MALEFREGADLVIQAELPGIDPERDVEVWISHDVLHIRVRGRPGPDERAAPSDLRDGAFVRDIALPAGTGEDHVAAIYADGRLEVRAPVVGSPEHATRRIPVLRGWRAPAPGPAGPRPLSPRRPAHEAAERGEP